MNKVLLEIESKFSKEVLKEIKKSANLVSQGLGKLYFDLADTGLNDESKNKIKDYINELYIKSLRNSAKELKHNTKELETRIKDLEEEITASAITQFEFVVDIAQSVDSQRLKDYINAMYIEQNAYFFYEQFLLFLIARCER